MTKLTLIAAALLATAVAAPVLAQDNASAPQPSQQPVKQQTIKPHAATMRHHASLRPGSRLGRAGEAYAQMPNVGAEANAPSVTSMAQDYARAYLYNGNSSDPVCKPGSTIMLEDGPHRCQ